MLGGQGWGLAWSNGRRSGTKNRRRFSATIAGRSREALVAGSWAVRLPNGCEVVSPSVRLAGRRFCRGESLRLGVRPRRYQEAGNGADSPLWSRKKGGTKAGRWRPSARAPRCDCGKSTRTVLSHRDVHRVRWRAWAPGSRGRAAKQAYWLIAAALAQAEPRNLATTNASVDMRADHRHPISTVAPAG